jgi:hypothetical protein
MARIKSALEIALERTGEVQSDTKSLGDFEAKQSGKKTANEFLGAGDINLAEALRKRPAQERAAFREGLVAALLSQLNLPALQDDLPRIERAAQGLQALSGDARFGGLMRQFLQIVGRYKQEAAQYEEAITRQYAPKLRAKEEDFARRFGQQIHLDPFQDPEFVAFFNQNMNALKTEYESTIGQIKDKARECLQGN